MTLTLDSMAEYRGKHSLPRRLQHVVNVSGGKDSDCCYLLAVERGRPFRAVFADTGNEHPWTYDHVRQLAARTGGPEVEWIKADFTDGLARRRERLPLQWRAAGVPEDKISRALELLQPTGNAYRDLVMFKGMFASGVSKKFCTEYLKIIPTDEYVIKPLLAEGCDVIQWLGIRADESPKRADVTKHPRFERSRGFRTTSFGLFRPILTWTVADVVEHHRKHGLPLNPLYARGFKRVGCFPCINERKDGLAIMVRQFPAEFDRIREWESLVAQVHVAWQRAGEEHGTPTFFPRGTVPGVAENPIDEVIRWATTKRGGVQQDMWAGRLEDEGILACAAGGGWCEA